MDNKYNNSGQGRLIAYVYKINILSMEHFPLHSHSGDEDQVSSSLSPTKLSGNSAPSFSRPSGKVRTNAVKSSLW